MRTISLLKGFLMLAVAVWITGSMSSCTSTRSLIFMQGSFDTAQLSHVNPVEPVIRKGDIISIIVYSDNPDATKIYNQSLIATASSSVAASSLSSGTSSPTAAGYQVDQNGDIVFQGLGKLHVEGLTKAILKDTLDIRLVPYLNNPYYSIRFLNYKFTMLGEVAKPGIINIPGERINLLEAFALAGDMTFYGRRDNVLIIRENNNKREFGRLDMTKPDIMKSPYFYLQQNDVVIVEPTKKKIGATDQTVVRNVSLAATVISLIAVIYSVFRK